MMEAKIMKGTSSVALVCALSGVALVSHSDPQQKPDAAGLFSASCLGCHVAPDSAFKSDQAWLGQISGTA